MSNPWEIAVLDDLAMVAHAHIQPVLAGEKDIIEAIREHYGLGAETIERMMSDTQMMTADAPVTESIDEIFFRSIDQPIFEPDLIPGAP